MEKFLYPTHPVPVDFSGPTGYGKSVFLTNLFLNVVNESNKTYIYLPILHQDINQKLIYCLISYILVHIIRNVLNEEDIDLVIIEIINKKDLKKSDTEIETCEPKEETKYPQDYEDGGIII